MKIYIASSWRNQHAVEMLTKLLREKKHEVLSFVENNYSENNNHGTKNFDFEKWVNSKQSDKSFKYDTNGATKCNLFIYISPAGKDAAAQCGMAWARGIPMLGLYAKGEDFGLMRKMFTGWFERYDELLNVIEKYFKK